MDYNHSSIIAKRIAEILEENEVTLREMGQIWEVLRDRLAVSFKPERTRRSGYRYDRDPKLEEEIAFGVYKAMSNKEMKGENDTNLEISNLSCDSDGKSNE